MIGRWNHTVLSGCLTSCLAGIANLISAPVPSQAAETISVRYGPFEQSLPVADLRAYAEHQQVSPALRDFLRFMSREEQQALQQVLETPMEVNRVALDRVLNDSVGIRFLSQASQALEDDRAGVQAIRAAAILGIRPQGLSPMSFLEAYPDRQLKIDLVKALKVMDEAGPKPPVDRLSSLPFWQTLVAYQALVSHNQSYTTCLFGDSISAELGNSLGPQTYNFSIGGMSTVSLVEQLQRLLGNSVKCQNVILAIGTNDAWYTIADAQFVQNLRQAIDLSRQLGAKQIVLLPAFYSTLAASKDPSLAGPIARVEAINRLLNQVAIAADVPVKPAVIQPLFEGQTLKAELTTDGVHLNAKGIDLYRQGLLSVLSTLPQ